MTEYDGQNRPLPWDLRLSLKPENTTEDDTGVPSSFVWPEDPTERTLVPFYLSQNEWKVLGSSIDVGRDIAYGVDSIRVLWLWLRNMREAVPICAAIIDCLVNDGDTHDAIAELIATNPTIGAALSQFINTHPGGTVFPKETILPGPVIEGNLLPENPGCDPDILWTQSLGLVTTANRMIEDFLDQWETYNNAGEILSAAVNATPGVGALADVIGLSGVIEYANTLLNNIAEAYSSDYTLEYEQDLACEIFCASKDTCSVSLDQLVSVMNARVSNQLTGENLVELLVSLVDQDVTGINVADLYLCFFFNALRVANLVVPVTWGIEAYMQLIRIFNEPSDDWEVLCTECPDPELWEVVSCGYGTVTKNSGPSIGVGNYVFTFDGDYYAAGGIWLGDFRWGDSGQQFVVTDITVNVEGSPSGFGGGIGTPYHRDGGSTASCADQSGLIEGLPIADSTTFYGGVGGATFPTYPWHITLHITVTERP